MGFLSKLLTALRGATNEAGQKAVDANAMRILDQELRDAEVSNGKAKDQLASIMAKKKLAEQKLDGLQADYERRMGQVRAALDKGDEDLARDVANAVKQIEEQGQTEQEVIATYDRTIEDLRGAIRDNDRTIEQLRREVDTVKANEALVKAQSAASVSHGGANSSLGNAADSLQRIKQRQAETRAKIEASRDLAQQGGDLDERLAKAGITDQSSSTDDILALAKSGEPKKLGSS
ncbi:PspA/IM30 family protein [Parvularcula dongshanensis]|uniref:Phage shock protein A n=1 Tax=Parvularcula dongshanensis TaxID=1173995 RepID=A0A840I6E8_9PROT|nr:PspA/IM30 family protein [Parvularcula dongshanensis]MBB4659754.1 phage shock protein A [Parvularcula dongshanensis]